MLNRKEADGSVLISQPAHAWVSGQLAQKWGNERFGAYAPADDVYMAAALHDIGFLNWEQSPTLNPQTGMPHCFRDLPTDSHFELWTKSVRKMMRYGRYSSLLVSLHFAGLCKKHRLLDSTKEYGLKMAFLKEQETHQTTLLTSLRNDFHYEQFTAPEILERNRELLAVWDWMSLSICLGIETETSMEHAPAASDTVKLTLIRKDALRTRVDPWPFKETQPIEIICEGRRLLSTFTDQTLMRQALRAASPTTVRMLLVP